MSLAGDGPILPTARPRSDWAVEQRRHLLDRHFGMEVQHGRQSLVCARVIDERAVLTVLCRYQFDAGKFGRAAMVNLPTARFTPVATRWKLHGHVHEDPAATGLNCLGVLKRGKVDGR